VTEAQRRQRIEELCEAALECDAAERKAFVVAACAGDETLQRDVLALLAHAHTAELFLETPIEEVAAHVMADHSGGAPLVGRQLGSHTILALIGRGGMGDVYRARDTTLQRDVAIKVVADTFLSDATRLARFEREARVLATLNHPNIAAIYGVEESGGIRGLVLELVEGETLADRLAVKRLAIAEALRMARQIAEALEAAHDKGVIHRDLKPANIKITPDDTVKVLDFGLAKVLSHDAPGGELAGLSTITVHRTQEGVIAGTAAYMSPEQARGLPVDKRTDVWAFGCVVYQMLTARVAFPGATFSDTIARVLEREPDWNALPAETPPAVRRLLQRCIEKDPRRRLRDIGDARLDIDEALDGTTASLDATVPGGVRGGPIVRARGRRLWTAAAVALLIMSAAAAWYARRPESLVRSPLEGARFTRLTSTSGTPHHAAISSDGKFVVYLREIDGTWDAWVTQVGTGDAYNLTKGRVRELRNPATRILGFSPDGTRVTFWSRVPDPVKSGVVSAGGAVPTLGGEVQPYLKGMPGGLSEFDWSPDGKRIVYHPPSDGDPLWINDLDGREGRKIFEARAGEHCHFPIWSRDGGFIYFVRGAPPPLDEMDIWRIPAAGGTPERLTFHNARVSFPTLLDNRTLLYLSTDDDGAGPWIHVMDVESRQTRPLNPSVDQYTSLAASADGQRLVATVARSTSTLWRVPITDRVVDESAAAVVQLGTTSGQSPRIGPDYIVYRAPIAGRDGLWKQSGSASTKLWRGAARSAIGKPAISRDGQRLAIVVRRPERWELYVMNADGSGERRLAEELDVRGTPSWSPDGRALAVAVMENGEPHVFKITVGDGAWVRLVNEYSLDPTWSPSGQFLVYSGADVGTTFPVKAVNADGTPREVPKLVLSRGERRLVFPGGENELIVLKGDISHKNFWSFDLLSGGTRQLTNLARGLTIGDFDVSADGREIIFDRTREDSDIVLFDLAGR
jgi:Tol biopolymer transport system component